MNAESLLSHYERVADSPDGVSRLRKFILNLAIRGKLLAQDPKDEPASELLKRIAREKVRLTRAGEIRTPKEIPALSEAPFPIPVNWHWSQLAEIGILSPRNEAPDSQKASFVPMSLIAAEYGVPNQQETRPWGEIKKGYTHFSEGDVGLAKITPCFENGKSTVFRDLTGGIGSGTTELHIVRPLVVDPDYILLFLKSPHFIESGIPKMSGTAGQRRVPTEYFAHSPFPLPPIEEQRRIVAKVDELMALCDRLETARTERETRRDRFAASSLARLIASDTETFRGDARFALNALPALTTRVDQIKQIRQTILNLAVRGKLVPQDSKDEPASELLRRIAVERTNASERKQAELAIDQAEYSGVLPKSWSPAPLLALGSWAIGSGFPKNEQGLDEGPHFFLKVSDMNLPGNEKYITKSNNFIDDDAAGRMRAKIHPAGTIIFPKIGGAIATNKRRILTRGSAIDNNCLGISFSSHVNTEWAYLLLTTLDFTKYQTGTAVPALRQGVLERIPVGLPPFAEQHRIVAKVNELMTLCDHLEVSLTNTDSNQCRLLDTLLAEALDSAA